MQKPETEAQKGSKHSRLASSSCQENVSVHIGIREKQVPLTGKKKHERYTDSALVSFVSECAGAALFTGLSFNRLLFQSLLSGCGVTETPKSTPANTRIRHLGVQSSTDVNWIKLVYSGV